MEVDEVLEAIGVLASTPWSAAGHDELAAASRSVARLQAFVDVAKVRIARRGRELAAAGDTGSAHVLLDEARCTGSDHRVTNARDRVCGQMPEFEAALVAGEVTGAHLDAVAVLSRGLDDAERADLAEHAAALVADAATQPAMLFERSLRGVIDRIRDRHRPGSDADELDRQRRASLVKRWTDNSTGMRHTTIVLDPLRDAAMWAVFDEQLRRLRRDATTPQRSFVELQVDAVLASIGSGDPAMRVPEVVVHVDASSLAHGSHEHSLCETIDGVALPVSTVQRLCCEAFIQAVVVNHDGTVDQICAEQRTANRAQRRMLAAMYPTCAHPHCTVGFSQCRIHHVIWWTNGGRTVLANLVPLCETHHHLVHEGGWNLTIDPARTLTWTRPDGTLWTTVEFATSRRQRPPPRAA